MLLLFGARADVVAVEAGGVHGGGEPSDLQHGGHGVVEDARAVVMEPRVNEQRGGGRDEPRCTITNF